MDTILNLYQQFIALTKSNPVIAGVVSLWGLTVVTFLFLRVPKWIFLFLKREFTTSLEMNNTHIGTNLETFNNFLRWHSTNYCARFSRSLSLNGGYYNSDGTIVGIGNGRHYLWYKRRFFWMTRQQVQQTGGYNVYFEIKINMIGRDRQRILDMIDEFKFKHTAGRVGVFTFEKEWARLTDVPKRRLETVILEKATKQKLIDNISEFKASRSWYEDRGLPFKLTMMLHGVPGTGKSSLIKALASHFEMHLCVLNLSTMSDWIFQRALSTAPENSIIVIEDFDSASATKARSSLIPAIQAPSDDADDGRPTDDKDARGSIDQSQEKPLSFLTLSGILNSLDGVVALDGTIVILTTNVLKDIDPAILRPGRIDRIVELKHLESPEVHDYVQLMFPDSVYDKDISFKQIAGCELQRLYFENKNDIDGFIDSIPKTSVRLRSVI